MTSTTLPKPSNLRAAWRAGALVLLALCLFIPVLVLWMLTLEKKRSEYVYFVYRVARRLSGIRITIKGKPSTLRPLMLVANHTSYLDIFVLGSMMPLCFTPKSEIRKWPVIGFFCVLADCVFIERKAADLQRAKAEMESKLRAGKVIALFPEGTTGDGYHIKPFKSGFLNLVEAHDLPLQPVSLAYTHIGDVPISAATRECVAWIGESTFVMHFLQLLRYPYVQVTAEFYGIERRGDHEDRKALAKSCENTIREGLHRTLEKNGVTG